MRPSSTKAPRICEGERERKAFRRAEKNVLGDSVRFEGKNKKRFLFNNAARKGRRTLKGVPEEHVPTQVLIFMGFMGPLVSFLQHPLTHAWALDPL